MPGYTLPSIPRVLLNKDPVENFERPNDVYIPGDCDESVWSLCQKLGWDKELRELHKTIDGFEADKERYPTERAETSTKPAAEDAVEQLAKELAEELRLDKEEDIEIRRLESQNDKDDAILKSDTEDDTAVVVDKKEDKDKDPTTEDSSKDRNEKL